MFEFYYYYAYTTIMTFTFEDNFFLIFTIFPKKTFYPKIKSNSGTRQSFIFLFENHSV